MISGAMTFAEFASTLMEMKRQFSNASDSAVRKAARDTMVRFRQTVVDMHGKYQDGAGAFPDWAELSEKTQRNRARKGYDPDRPLYETGEMKGAWELDESADAIAVVNTTPYAVFHEEGTPYMPQRSTVGLALVREEDRMRAYFEQRLKRYMRYKTGRA